MQGQIDPNIIISIISGLFLVFTNLIAMKASHDAVTEELKRHNAVQDERLTQVKTQIEQLSARVEKHNGFGERIPLLEAKIDSLYRRIDKLEARLDGITDDGK